MRIRATYRLTENPVFMYVLQTDFKQVYYDYIFVFKRTYTFNVENKTFKHVYLHNSTSILL